MTKNDPGIPIHFQRPTHPSKVAAWRLLQAAKFLRAGKPLPDDLAEWLATAFEEAVKHPWRGSPANGETGHALLAGLGLKANNRRKTGLSRMAVGFVVDILRCDGRTKTRAIKEVAAELGYSYGTIRALYADYCAGRGEWESQKAP